VPLFCAPKDQSFGKVEPQKDSGINNSGKTQVTVSMGTSQSQRWDLYAVESVKPSDYSEGIMAIWNEKQDANSAMNASVYQWFFGDYPFPGLHSYGLFHQSQPDHDSQLIGIQAIMVRDWMVEGEPAQMGNVCALIVGKQYRSLGPAMKLVRTTLESVPTCCDFCYGFPNRFSEPLFKRVGSHLMGDIARYSKLLRVQDFLARHPRLKHFAKLAFVADGMLALEDRWKSLLCRKLHCEEVSSPDQRFDALWADCDKQRWVIGERGSRYLSWRLQQFPRVQNRILAFHEGDPQRLAGYVAYFDDGEGNFFIEDFLSRDGLPGLKGLLLQFLRYARRCRARSVSVEFFGDEDVVALLRQLRFYRRDSRPVYTVDGKYKTDVLKSKRWYITHVDEDQ